VTGVTSARLVAAVTAASEIGFGWATACKENIPNDENRKKVTSKKKPAEDRSGFSESHFRTSLADRVWVFQLGSRNLW
jgi:hypothetical protein